MHMWTQIMANDLRERAFDVFAMGKPNPDALKGLNALPGIRRSRVARSSRSRPVRRSNRFRRRRRTCRRSYAAKTATPGFAARPLRHARCYALCRRSCRAVTRSVRASIPWRAAMPLRCKRLGNTLGSSTFGCWTELWAPRQNIPRALQRRACRRCRIDMPDPRRPICPPQALRS